MIHQMGKTYIVCYDHYRPSHARYQAVATTDWKHWKDMAAETSLPDHAKHGSFLKIGDEEATQLFARRDAPKGNDAAAGAHRRSRPREMNSRPSTSDRSQ
ncbi:MAG: hypothetical protein ACRD3N_16500 [Terracidiphilus sp.]